MRERVLVNVPIVIREGFRGAWRPILAAVAVIAMSGSAWAQSTFTWLGAAGNGVWQSGTFQNNWAGGVYAPGNSGTNSFVFTGTPFSGPATITLQGPHNPNVGSLTINGNAGSPLTILITNTNSSGDNKLDFMGTGETLTVESGGSGSKIRGTTNARGGFINLITNSENRWAINGASTVFTIEAEIVGSSAARYIDKRGTGTLVLSGSNNFAGGTILTEGRLEFGNVNALGTGTVGTSTVTFAGGSLRAGVSGTVANPFAINTGVTGTFDTQANSVVLSRASGLLSGDATTNLVKVGTGTLALGGTSSFTGTLTVNAGTLWAQGITSALSADISATSIVVNDGATFQFGNATTGDPNLADTTYLTLNPGGRAVWQEGETFGGVNLAGGTLDLQQGSVSVRGGDVQSWTSGTITNTRTNGTYAFEARNIIDKTTAGIVSISGSASVTGTGSLRILAGEVFHAASENLGSIAVTLGSSTTAGTFAYGGATASRGAAFTLDGLGGTFRVDDAAAVLTLSGTLGGGGGLVKAGLGTLALSAANTVTGTVSIASGTLALAGGSVANAAAIFVGAGSVFDVSAGGFTLTPGQSIGGAGSILGDMAFGAGSKLVFSMNDPLIMPTGTASFFSGPVGARFGIDDLLGINASTPEGVYTLISGVVDTTNLDNLTAANPYDLGGGKLAYFQSDSLQVVIVPEPGALILAAAGLAGAAAGGQRRRRTLTVWTVLSLGSVVEPVVIDATALRAGR